MKSYKRLICGVVPQAAEPRVHFKCLIADGRKAYFGSANLTGAGMSAKSARKRNFENGILTDDPVLVEQFDSVWRGDFCRDCGRRTLECV